MLLDTFVQISIFVWLEFEFKKKSFLFVTPTKCACGRWDLRLCIKPITYPAMKCSKQFSHSFSDAVDMEQTMGNFHFFACCTNTWVCIRTKFIPSTTKLTKKNYYLFSLEKKVSSCYDGRHRAYCCVIFCQFTTPE